MTDDPAGPRAQHHTITPPESSGSNDHTFRPTNAAKRAALPAIAARFWVVVPAAILGLLDHPAVIIFGLFAAGHAFGEFRRRFQRILVVGPGGVAYSEGDLDLRTAWANVTGLVRLSDRAHSLALLLSTSALADQRKKGAFDLGRSTPYPYDRVIPIHPFVDSLEGSQLGVLLRAYGPRPLTAQPERFRRAKVVTGTRAVGLAVVALPLGVTLAGYGLVLGGILPSSMGPAISYALVLVSFTTPALLFRYRGTTGERYFDFVGRSIVGSGPHESRSGALLPLFVSYLVMFGALQIGSLGRPAPVDPDCRVSVNLSGEQPRPEPSWPGDPDTSRDLTLGDEWTQIPLSEVGLRQMPGGLDSDEVRQFERFVREQIRLGMVQLAEIEWRDGWSSLRRYEYSCPGIRTTEGVGALLDMWRDQDESQAIGRERSEVSVGWWTVQRETFSLSAGDDSWAVQVYAWPDSGVVQYLWVQTTGSGDPRELVQHAIGRSR